MSPQCGFPITEEDFRAASLGCWFTVPVSLYIRIFLHTSHRTNRACVSGGSRGCPLCPLFLLKFVCLSEIQPQTGLNHCSGFLSSLILLTVTLRSHQTHWLIDICCPASVSGCNMVSKELSGYLAHCHHLITVLLTTIASHHLCWNCIGWKNSAENHQQLEHLKSLL